MGLLSPLGSIDLLIICPGGRGGRVVPPRVYPPIFCLFFNRMVVGMALWGGGGVALIFRISVVRGGGFIPIIYS